MAYRGKHRRGGKSFSERQSQQTKDVDEDNPIIQAFRLYQNQLDDRHDRHERIVKLSRDITIDSKRTIFLLHRISGDQNRDSVLAEAKDKLDEIQQKKWRTVAEELRGQDPYRFLRAYSPGLQEYIEAVSFYHYQKHGTLVSQAEVEAPLSFMPQQDGTQDEKEDTPAKELEQVVPPQSEPEQAPNPVSIHIPPMEYVLGLADLTGELMRMAINSVGAGEIDTAFSLCSFMREIHQEILQLGTSTRDLRQKINVLYASIKKVETACYTVQVRGSEIPKHMLTQALLAVPADVGSDAMNDED